MKKRSFATLWASSFMFVLLLASCQKSVDDQRDPDDQLIGNWADTNIIRAGGHTIFELTFNEQHTFSDKSSSYGLYEGQDDDELSGWFLRTGDYAIDGDKLALRAGRTISWDSFYGGDPDTINAYSIVFENCTYRVTGDTLVLNYTTYPDDAPVNTVRKYLKQNN